MYIQLDIDVEKFFDLKIGGPACPKKSTKVKQCLNFWKRKKNIFLSRSHATRSHKIKNIFVQNLGTKNKK